MGIITLETLNTIRANASPEYQRQVPVASQENFYAVRRAFETYTPLYNEFLDNLINKIGRTTIEQKLFTNDLAVFKTGKNETAQDVEEIFIEMAKQASKYDSQGLNALARSAPTNIKVNYHRLNREDTYDITIADRDFKRNFRSIAQFDEFMTGQLNSVYSRANYDEWVWMKKILATYGHTPVYTITTDVAINETKGYFTKNGEDYIPVANPVVGDIATYYEDTATAWGYCDYEVPAIATAEDVKTIVKTVRKAVMDVKFASTLYNASGVKTWSNPEDLILIANKDLMAEVDVEVLAKAFNMGKTDFEPKIITIDNFDSLPDTYGLLIDKNFYRIYDVLTHTEPMRNAKGLFTNYYHHVQQIMSASKFKNAIRLKKTTA
jgi:hypothetical protein